MNKIKAHILTILLALAFTAAPVVSPVLADSANRVSEPQFFETLNDIPLMPGLYELLDESVVFDQPDGRFAESSAASEDMENAEIEDFYQQTLPQMGWTRIAPESYVRADESLTMSLEKDGRYSVVRFTVKPR